MSNRSQKWLLYKTDQGLPQLLHKALQQGHFKEVSGNHNEESWNLYWKACGFTHTDYTNVKGWQILNHFPKGNIITRKDSLARCLKRMRMVYGPVYNFSPVSFNLPNDYTKFLSYSTKMQNRKRKQVWICKPSDMSRGRGIFLFSSLSELLYDGSTVVQRYIDNPYLIGGYKFDLRLYVVVTSYHPLRVYLHHDGLVRFSTEKYVGSVLENRYAHLTNTSINRNGPNYSVDKESVGAGCKWTISQLRTYFQQRSIDDRLVWERIKHMVTLTILMQINSIPDSAKQCIELYGFDVLLDNKMKPWLLEVNFTPALGNDCSVDESVKLPMLTDLLSLARHKMLFPRPSTEHKLRRNNVLSRHARIQKEELDKKEEEFDDVFRNRFIMEPDEIERMNKIEQKFTKIPDINNTNSIIGPRASAPELDSVSRCSTVSSRKLSSLKTVRSRSSGSSRNPPPSSCIAPSEQRIGGFFLTYPISNSSHGASYSKGVTDVAVAVAEIRNTLRISENSFKFLPSEKRQLYERTTVNWNGLSGFKSS